MAKIRKTWQEKLADDKDLPKVVEITDKIKHIPKKKIYTKIN